jgi:hypothetical protein
VLMTSPHWLPCSPGGLLCVAMLARWVAMRCHACQLGCYALPYVRKVGCYALSCSPHGLLCIAMLATWVAMHCQVGCYATTWNNAAGQLLSTFVDQMKTRSYDHHVESLF